MELERDPKWESVEGYIETRGKHVHFEISVRLKNGLLVSQHAFLLADDLDVSRFNLYGWMLDGMVKKLDETVQARV